MLQVYSFLAKDQWRDLALHHPSFRRFARYGCGIEVRAQSLRDLAQSDWLSRRVAVAGTNRGRQCLVSLVRSARDDDRRSRRRQGAKEQVGRQQLLLQADIFTGIAADDALRPGGKTEVTSDPQPVQIPRIVQSLVSFEILQFPCRTTFLSADIPLRVKDNAGGRTSPPIRSAPVLARPESASKRVRSMRPSR